MCPSRATSLSFSPQPILKIRSRGDLPDWVACAADLIRLTAAEARGCHDPRGPDKALARGWTQAQRIDVTAKGRKLTIKRCRMSPSERVDCTRKE